MILSLRKSRSETFSFRPWITTTGLYASDSWIKLPIKLNTRIIFIIFYSCLYLFSQPSNWKFWNYWNFLLGSLLFNVERWYKDLCHVILISYGAIHGAISGHLIMGRLFLSTNFQERVDFFFEFHAKLFINLYDRYISVICQEIDQSELRILWIDGGFTRFIDHLRDIFYSRTSIFCFSLKSGYDNDLVGLNYNKTVTLFC